MSNHPMSQTGTNVTQDTIMQTPSPSFTPGPWRAGQGLSSNTWGLHAKDSGYLGAFTGLLDTKYDEQNKANAHLIESAPALYAALELAVATIERLSVKHPGGLSSVQGTLDVAGAAIAQARGDSELREICQTTTPSIDNVTNETK